MFARTLYGNGVRLDSIDGAGAGGIKATVAGRRVIFSRDVGDGQAEALKNIMPEHPDARVFDLRSPGEGRRRRPGPGQREQRAQG